MKYLVTVSDCPDNPFFISQLTKFIKDAIVKSTEQHSNDSDIDVRASDHWIDGQIHSRSCITIHISSINRQLIWGEKFRISQHIRALIYDKIGKVAVVIHVF